MGRSINANQIIKDTILQSNDNKILKREMKNIYDANLESKFQDRVVANLTRDWWREKVRLRLNKLNKEG